MNDLIPQFPEYDPSDPVQVRAAEEAAEWRQQELAQSTLNFLRTYDGRAFLWSLLQETQYDAPSIFCGEQPMTMAHAEGRRSVGAWLVKRILTLAPETYTMMRREAVDREQRYAQLAGLTE